MTKFNIVYGNIIYYDVLYADFSDIRRGVNIISKEVGALSKGIVPVRQLGLFRYYVSHIRMKTRYYKILVENVEKMQTFDIPVQYITTTKDVSGEHQYTYNIDAFLFGIEFEGLQAPYEIPDYTYLYSAKVPARKGYTALENEANKLITCILGGKLIQYKEAHYIEGKLMFSAACRYLERIKMSDSKGNPLSVKDIKLVTRGFRVEDSQLFAKKGVQLEFENVYKRFIHDL